MAEIKGISEKMAMSIAEQIEEKRDMRQAMMFLQDYGVSMNLAAKIYREYGPAMYGIIKQNPYKLADDIPGVGFKMADEIAARAGILTDSDFRIKSGILYTLLKASGNGHTYLPKEILTAQAAELLGVEQEEIENRLMDMQMEKRLVVKRSREEAVQEKAFPDEGRGAEITEVQETETEEASQLVYASQYYYTELNTAKMLHDLNITGDQPEESIRKSLKKIQRQENIELDELQIQAVIEAVNCGLLIITGGPGTGKTTTINTIIRYFELGGLDILLAAPTGRAAKRMTEATGFEAKTIHRLLELSGAPVEEKTGDAGERSKMANAGMRFERNEENPLDADVIIIDEMSMVDIHLMHSLLRAVNVGTRLILVGDVDQLPSVGPGNVLRDMIESQCFHVVKLTRIFRQAAQSDIVVNAHRINEGSQIPLGKKSLDFLFIRQEDPNAIVRSIITLVREKLPGYVHAEMFDIQIMTPMRKGALGVERLNEILQKYLNPPSPEKKERESGGTIFRTGDKVMQIKNNYQMEWELRNQYGVPVDKGSGVFNGDVGIIRDINAFSELMTVEFDEGKMVEYSFKQLEELELAYAITIHKSQGSEYPAVVLPIYPGPRMLMTRNLIYTAVTRAKSCVCLVGIPQVFQSMVDNASQQKRYCGLKDRIQEIEESLM